MIGFIILCIFLALIVLSFLIISNKDLAHSVILFMGFGLGATILYFLFSAPDVALTEAVIGAGLSSVVLLVALLQTKQKELS
ncbi:MAG: hydrogenase subunit MbhD domain-containing protein [Campylobacterota bacterium]|nr:hydrogenase subunit MbhD domain-containing protein [Campylobacterota bacterium]